MSGRFNDALVFANDLHREQHLDDLDTGPTSHPVAVASLALKMGADEDEAIAALFHDAVQDQSGAPRLVEITGRFGDRVARILADCTDWNGTGRRPPWRKRKRAYLKSLSSKPVDALLIALAAKTLEVRSIVGALAVHGNVVWDQFTGGRTGVLWYYSALAEVFSRSLPSAGSARFIELVEQMSTLE